MKKILFVVPSLSKGGAERMVSRISTELAKDKDFDVSILYFFDTENKYEVGNEVKLFNLSNGDEKQYNDISKVKRILKIRKYIKDYNPDYIVPFLDHVSLYVFLACMLTKYSKRIICTERNNPSESKNIKIKKFLFKKAKKIVVQNDGQKRFFSEKLQSKMVVIPNFLEDKYFEFEKEYSKEIINVTFMGRMNEQKNIPLLINAFSNLNANNVFLHLYGEGDNKNEYLVLAKKSSKKDFIIFEGRTEKPIDVLLNSDLFVLSSNFEGMPNVLMEAMALGVPCISTDCDYGPRDLIINNENGILVPVNSEKDLHNAIQYLVDNPDIAKQYGQAAKDNIRKVVGKEINIQKWKDLFI